MPTGGLDLAAAIGGAIGVDAATVTAVAEAVGIGAGVGGLTGEITGGTKGLVRGLETGALTGFGGGVGSAALGGFGGAALGGAAGGALGSGVTGGNPLTGALEGGVGSGLSAAIGGNTSLFGTGTSGVGGATNSPVGGTGGGASTAAPSSVGLNGGDISAGTDISLNPDTFAAIDSPGATGGATGETGSQNPFSTANTGSGPTTSGSSTNVGQGTGTPSISSPSGTTPFSTAAGSANTGSSATDSLVNSFSAEQAASAPAIDSLSPQVIAADNAASPGGVGTLKQPSLISRLTGSQTPISQASAPVGAAIGGAAATPNTIATAFKDPSLSNITAAIGANGGPLLAGAGLVGDLALSGKKLPGQEELSKEAGSLAAQGQTLQQYLQTGTLPPGLQGALDSASNSAIATIKSRYASHGMSGSSAEQDAIAQVKESMAAQGSQMALQLLQTGVSESEGAAQLYQSIMNSALTQDANLGSAIGRFATSASGGTPQAGISINGKNVTI